MNTIKDFKKVMRFPLRYMPLMLIATLTINILGLALPLTMKQIYSRVIVYQSKDTLIVLLSACFIALLLESIMKRTKEDSSKWIASKYEYLLSIFLIKKVLNIQNMSQKNLNAQGNLDRFKSISAIASYYANGFFQLFVDLPFVFLYLALIYFLSGRLVLIPVAMISLYVLLMTVITKMYIARRKEQMRYNEEMMVHLNQSLVKIHLIKSAGIEEFVINKFKEKIRGLTESDFRVKKLEKIPSIIGGYVVQFNLFATFIYGGYLVMESRADFGMIIVAALLGGRAISPVMNIMRLLMQHNDVKTQKKNVEELAFTEEQYDDRHPPFPDDINGSLELLSFVYKDINNANKTRLNCRIKAGSFVYIDPQDFLSYREILAALTGKVPIEEGKILIDSMDISKWNMDSLRGKIEYLTDSVPIFKGTIMENITLFDDSKNRDVYDAAALTGFDKNVIMMPEGFETKLDSQSRNSLQSSFMQRLNLTRALLYKPRILVVDRIDSSMDQETMENFLWILGKLKGNVTIIIATSNRQIIELANEKLTKEGIVSARR